MIYLAEAPAAFIRAACVPVDGSWHASGTLDEAQAILAAHPEVNGSSIHVAAILADEARVRRFLALDPGAATAPGGPYGWDPLTHLCFSRYLRLAPARSKGFLRAAAALLNAGASANTGFYSTNHDPPEFESAIYGATGVAHHPELTRLLPARGADPNDGEAPYHAPETLDAPAPHRDRPGNPPASWRSFPHPAAQPFKRDMLITQPRNLAGAADPLHGGIQPKRQQNPRVRRRVTRSPPGMPASENLHNNLHNTCTIPDISPPPGRLRS